jgi:hypothetical protein
MYQNSKLLIYTCSFTSQKTQGTSGYNQVSTFKTLANALELNYNETILLRTKYSKPSPKKLTGEKKELLLSLTLIFRTAPQHAFLLSMTYYEAQHLKLAQRPY